jgi:hypothetical protein
LKQTRETVSSATTELPLQSVLDNPTNANALLAFDAVINEGEGKYYLMIIVEK